MCLDEPHLGCYGLSLGGNTKMSHTDKKITAIFLEEKILTEMYPLDLRKTYIHINKIRDVSRLDQCGLLSTQTGGRHRFVFSCIPILLPFPHPFLDAHCASISSTYPCTTVGRSVTLFLIPILSASLSPNKAARSWWPTWWPT